ncbi:unnamed protein product [Microthlaspi erraticum]|uniref:F-box associated beta-propeller type 3 domain-containing protein n=1 Tax=Microthlaspi erraticum TaxID=1685480 RepID=A0A6D2KAT3_9BRAS|nr:unnamed protein product [Microthlaspi erraticum]
MIQEIISRLPASDVGKSRLLNKETNERSYESWFLNLNLHRTNSISGYFAQYYGEGYKYKNRFIHERRGFENNKVSIDFLPPGNVKIEACDASNGIMLCALETGPSAPEFIVCKPTTKQYQIIPDPIMQNLAVSFGLAVIQSNPFRYKILRLSPMKYVPRINNRNHRTFACEVFDSGSFSWKRIKNLRIPRNDGLALTEPVEAAGFFHWLSWEEKVIRFCLQTESWSFFQTPKFGISPKLVRYEGKLGVIRSWFKDTGEKFYRLWVLERSCEKLWVEVKDVKNMGIGENVLWTQCNDVVTFSACDRLFSYDTNTEKVNIFHVKKVNYVCFPFCSDYEKVDLDQNVKEEDDAPNAI